MNQEQQAKKPIALAVTLVIIVILAMCIVLLVTKNIGLQQEKKVDQGNHIFHSFSEAQQHLQHLENQLNDLQSYAAQDFRLARSTAKYAAISMEHLQEEIVDLLQYGTNIDESLFTEKAIEQKADAVDNMKQTLLNIGSASGTINETELQELQVITMNANKLKQYVNSFNYSMEGNKNAMIRLSGGFEWIEIGQQIDQFVNIDAVR